MQNVVGFAVGLAARFVAFWNGLKGFIAGVVGVMVEIFAKAANFIIDLFKPLFQTVQDAIDIAKKIPAIGDSFKGLDITGGLNKLQGRITTATEFQAGTAGLTAPTEVKAPVNVGGVQVTIQGSTNMNAADIVRATAQGTTQGADAMQRAMRDVQAVGGT